MACGGVSSNTAYIESASGVGEGARTGLASIVTGLLFLVSIFFAPLVRVIPSEAAVPALVLVGFLMMQQVKGISWDDAEIAIPAFLTIVLMPFTYSITVGIGAGFVAYVADQGGQGQVRAGPPPALGGRRPLRRLLRHQPHHRPLHLTPSRRKEARETRRVGAKRHAENAESSPDDSAFGSESGGGPECLAWVMSYANDMPTVEMASRTDAGLASELRLSVMRLRRRLAGERHPDNVLSMGADGRARLPVPQR